MGFQNSRSQAGRETAGLKQLALGNHPLNIQTDFQFEYGFSTRLCLLGQT